MAKTQSIKKSTRDVSNLPAVVISDVRKNLEVASKSLGAICETAALLALATDQTKNVIDLESLANGLDSIATQIQNVVDRAIEQTDHFICDGSNGRIIGYNEKAE